jgi:TonB-linked SusC/RagA family outer membrane protein
MLFFFAMYTYCIGSFLQFNNLLLINLAQINLTMNKLIHNLLVVLLASPIALAQQVSGTVTEADSGAPLPGATVLVKGTNNGTTTDFDGMFQITGVPGDAILVVSYLGFETQEVAVNNATSFNVALSSAADTLDEIVVIGYGTQSKKEVTGAVSVLGAEAIQKLNPVRAEQAIQGQVAGVNITSQSGSPGSGLNIRIRGITTNGNNAPLILVDGNRIGDLNALNPNDIESINVLKDATAGIYGVQGANGVILITTKSGRKNSELNVNVDSYTGLQVTSKKLDLLNSFDFAQYVNDLKDKTEFFVYPQSGTDWQDEVFEVAPISEVNATVKGGGEKSAYTFAAGYLDQDGIVGGSSNNYERVTARINYEYDILDNLKVTANALHFKATKQKLTEGGIGAVLYNAVNINPTMSVYDENGAFALANDVSQIEIINPLAQIANTYDTDRVSKWTGLLALEYDFWGNFTAKTQFNINHATVLTDIYRPEQYYGNGKSRNTVSSVAKLEDEISYNEIVDDGANYNDIMWDSYITYKNTFNDVHDLTVLLGTSYFNEKGLFFGNSANTDIGTNMPGQSVWDPGMEDLESRFDDEEIANGDDRYENNLFSTFARVQYNYKGKYLFSGVLRRDMSSRFSTENNRHIGYFPSGSIGWNVSEEDFLQNADWISNLKLRASYGIIGNDRINVEFPYLTGVNGHATLDPGQGVSGTADLLRGAATGTQGNPELKWEEQENLNVGIDLSLFDNRLSLTADAYRKQTKDLLLAPQASAVTGIAAPGSGVPYVNAGTVQNQGLELSLGFNDNFTDDLNFNFNFNITTIDNEVLSLNNRTAPVGGEYGVGISQTEVTRMAPGFALGHYYGYKTDGIYQTQSEIDALDAAAFALHGNDVNGKKEVYHTIADIAPGDLRFVDMNGDGQITAADRTNIGDPIPDLEMGLNIGFTYKNLDFSASAFASIGHELVRDYERKDAFANRGTYMLRRWQGSGTSNTVPRAAKGANINTDFFNDFHVEDASYVRLQNVQIGYNFTDLLGANSGIDNFRIYVSGNNLFTITDYNGYDPSANTGAPLGGGIDKGFYPIATTYLLGINLNF